MDPKESFDLQSVRHDRPVAVCRDGPNALMTARGPQHLAAFDAALVRRLSASV
jgi:hypothetical protein